MRCLQGLWLRKPFIADKQVTYYPDESRREKYEEKIVSMDWDYNILHWLVHWHIAVNINMTWKYDKEEGTT